MAYSSVSLLFLLTITLTSCHGNKLGLDFHHRFSHKVQKWTDSRGLPSEWKSEEAPRGSVEYYQRLLEYDFHRHRGRLLAAGDIYTFNHGNETFQYLDQLHYAFVDLGTPNQTFLVALDTGSDLFWVPCSCKQCAPNTDPSYGNLAFSTYAPNDSITSEKISCGSNQCFTTPSPQCTNKSADCTYTVNYGGTNTSSSGTLVQDVLYLINQKKSELVKLSIVFGCGQVQTGNLLNGASSPNGLMGLGLSNNSVPSMIANSGFTSNSFSMCFGANGHGQLNFGDKNSRGHNTTDLNINPNQLYNISLTGISVGSSVSKLSFTAIIDSGSSISTFTDDIYRKLGISFSAQVIDQPIAVKGSSLEYCFEISATQTKIKIPPVSFTTKGGSTFSPPYPIILLYAEKNSSRAFAYCLGIMSSDINIIGENFLVGQHIVFDREKKILGWKPFNCGGSENNNTTAPVPAPALAPSTPEPSTAPSPEMEVADNSAWSNPVARSAILSIAASIFSMTVMFLQFY